MNKLREKIYFDKMVLDLKPHKAQEKENRNCSNDKVAINEKAGCVLVIAVRICSGAVLSARALHSAHIN